MKNILTLIVITFLSYSSLAQNSGNIKLNPPDLNRGFPVMKALSLRASESNFDTTSLNLRDLSDLLWAANGINRPDAGKRTAPSALNAQDIDLYIIMKSGAYYYNPTGHLLELITDGDYRNLVADRQAKFADAPIFCVMVSDISKFPFGTDSLKFVWAAEDAGIVSENISVFCAGVNMATRPRSTMNREKIHELLKLKESQYLILNNPVSYKK